jgi:outer membrane protein assembly factor BamD
MINSFPDSTLVPRAKQKLREVQEVLGEREFLIGQYYASRDNWSGAIARLQTVADTYPLYSHSDQLWLTIGDAYAGEARSIHNAAALPGAVKERLTQVYQDKAAAAYSYVVTKYPMAPHVEDARDRLIAMNRHVPEPTEAAVSESDAIERSRTGVRFTDKAIGIVKHGPVVVEAARVGDPTMVAPKRTIAPDVNKANNQNFAAAYKASQPGAANVEAPAPTPTTNNEPPRSDRPQAPLQFENVPTGEGTGTGISATIVSAPNSAPADPNAPVKAVGTTNTALPPIEPAAAAPAQVNDIKTTSAPVATTAPDPNAKPTKKKPKLDESDESSSKKKKKKGLAKLNPF